MISVRPAHFLLGVVILTFLTGTAGAADVPTNGWVVWASNRKDGRHEIYLMKADGTGVTRLTFNGGSFPAWSPDGKWIAYNHSDGSVHVMRYTGGSDKKVCDGTLEFWLWDKTGLVCGQGDSHYKVNADTGSKSLLFSKSDFSQLGSKSLSPTSITADGHYLMGVSDIYRNGYSGSNGSFTAYWSAVILDFQDKSKLYYFGSGCEPASPPSGTMVYHVCGDCPTATDIYRMNLADLATRSSYEAEIALDDANWGHEYFPRISNDNVWLTYGATTGCHDHETCDYEIFIHRLGAGNSNRTRLTTDPNNDNWPHLFVGTLVECVGPGDCDDKDACTADSCSGGSCQHSKITGCCTSGTQCDDGNKCTSDSCSGNKCLHDPLSNCCSQDSDCADNNPCTQDSCDKGTGKCSTQKISDCCSVDTDCDDGNSCTLDKCSGNKCEHTANCPDFGVESDAGIPSGSDAGADGGAGDGGKQRNSLSGGCAMVADSTAAPRGVLLLALFLLALAAFGVFNRLRQPRQILSQDYKRKKSSSIRESGAFPNAARRSQGVPRMVTENFMVCCTRDADGLWPWQNRPGRRSYSAVRRARQCHDLAEPRLQSGDAT